MAATWEKLSDKPKDKGLYRNPASGSIRVAYQAVELRDGKRVTIQKAQSFPKNGDYRITLPDGTSKRVGVEVYARDFKQQRDRERKAGLVRDVAHEEMTLNAYFSRWIGRPSNRTGEKRRPSTLARVEESYRVHIKPNFGELPIRSITRTDVLDWHAGLICGPAARNKAVRTLRSILASAVAEDLRNDNPASGLKATDRVRAIEAAEVFTPEQIEKLREAMPNRYKLMIDLLGFGGMRLAEVIGLRRSSVDLRGDVKVERQVTEVDGKLVEGPPKSHNGYRMLPLHHLAGEIQEHVGGWSQRSSDGFVFTSDEGHAPIRANNWRRRVFYPALQVAKLPKVPPHALRHRVACDLLDRGFSIDQVARWLGDNPGTIRTTYANVLPTTGKQIGDFLRELHAARAGGMPDEPGPGQPGEAGGGEARVGSSVGGPSRAEAESPATRP
jgi:integrase